MRPLDCLEVYEDAELYDQEFASRDHEIPFYRDWALSTGGPVLELACGTGRLTLPIAVAGLEIVGVDVSPSMIERARLHAAQAGLDVQWYVQDVRHLDLGRRFRLAFMATNALQHLHDHDSLLAFFARARDHLEPDGVLLVDVFNPSVAKLARPPGPPRLHKELTLPDGRVVQVLVDGQYRADTQILRFGLEYRCGTRVLATKDVTMRCLFPEELLGLCRMAGWKVVERFGDYDRSPFTAASPKQILVCRPAA